MQSDSGTGSVPPEGINLPWKPRSRQEQGRQTEAKVVKIGLRAHPNSGAGSIKYDASDDETLVEVKDANKSYTLNAAYLEDLFKTAARQNKTAVMVVKFPNIIIEAIIYKESP